MKKTKVTAQEEPKKGGRMKALLDTASQENEAVIRHRVPWYVDAIAVVVILGISAGLAIVTAGEEGSTTSAVMSGKAAGIGDAAEPYAVVDPKSPIFLALAAKLRAEGREAKAEEVHYYRTPEPEMEMYRFRYRAADKDRIFEAYQDSLEKWVFNEIPQTKPAEQALSASSLLSWFKK